jgi:hypothetical protein
MFHWICPECGQEIAPGVKECPVCEPQASAFFPSSTADPITAVKVAGVPAPDVATAPLAEQLAPAVKLYAEQPAPAAPQPAPAAQQNVVQPLAMQPSALEQPVQKPTVVLQPEVLLRPEAIVQAKTFHGTKPPEILDAIPAETHPVMMPDVSLGISHDEVPDQLLEPVFDCPPQPETFADRLADLADLLHGERIPYPAPRIFQESAAPGPRVEIAAEKTPLIVDVTFHEDVTPEGAPARALLAAPPSLLLLAEPQPPSAALGIPIEAFDPHPAVYAVRSQDLMGADQGAGLAAGLVADAAASPVRLPEPLNRSVAPALAPLQDYCETADRLMRPVELAAKIPSSKALPTVTLPGPALPRELMSLQAAGLVPIRKGGKRGETPRRNGWVMKYVVVGMLLTAGLATYSLMPGSSTSAPPRPTPEPTPEPPVSTQSSRANSLARFVEVTGVRFMEVNKKPQIHYLVVNHSGAPLTSMTVYVTLRATNARSGQPPIAKLTFRSPALAAFEAKEMFSSIERTTAPVDLPDWQDLRADVDVQ